MKIKKCCGNCFHGHYNLSERGEELYCTENGYSEVDVDPNYRCKEHVFEEGYEEDILRLFEIKKLLGILNYVIEANKPKTRERVIKR